MVKMQRALRLIFPPQCLSCDALVETEFSLCATCWRDTPFIGGLVCNDCGTPLPGEDTAVNERCDDCIVIARPWVAGHAALLYQSNARRLVLSLKHGDRHDLARPAVQWMAAASKPLIQPDMVVVPFPAHWLRLLKRRYNQAAILAKGLASQCNLAFLPDPLVRSRRTKVQDGMGRNQRFSNLSGAVIPHPRHPNALNGRDVLLVDDVMTSGATLAAATEACHASGANRVFISVLARVAKDT
jgi:predicted amidophosphoribosyltransferase